jgi:hypothetical protein
MRSQRFFFEMSHAFSEVTSVTCDRFVRNSGFEAQIIADLRPILRVPPRQRYRGASGGLLMSHVSRVHHAHHILYHFDQVFTGCDA